MSVQLNFSGNSLEEAINNAFSETSQLTSIPPQSFFSQAFLDSMEVIRNQKGLSSLYPSGFEQVENFISSLNEPQLGEIATEVSQAIQNEWPMAPGSSPEYSMGSMVAVDNITAGMSASDRQIALRSFVLGLLRFDYFVWRKISSPQ